MNNRSKAWIPLAAAIALALGMWLGYLLAGGNKLTPAQQKLNNILALIRNEYVDTISDDSLVEMAIPTLIKNLDPHSLYIPLADTEKANRDIESSFYGIGVQFQLMNDSVYVVEVVSGGPSERVGVLAGDRIIEADGRSLTGSDITNDDVMSTLRGALGSKVTIKVKRNTSKRPLKFEITRAEIPNVSVDAAYMIEPTTGYLRLNKFAVNTFAEFLQSINSLRVKGAKNYIIDLRGNTGGLLDQAILIANEFLPAMRQIVSVKGRHEDENTTWIADGTGAFGDEQLVLLVDEFTASSSEIVAGAIQDNDRGLLIGRRTFGKGLVQRQIVLPDSSQVRLTVQRYYTPSGRCIQKLYTRGANDDYQSEILERYANGEICNADSIKIDARNTFKTSMGRTVYGGGGIIPDKFVPSDTTGVTGYYLEVMNAGIINKFAYEYADLNRSDLEKCKTTTALLKKLPPDAVLLDAFVSYAADNGVHKRWYYISQSSKLIVSQLKALIARDILGMTSYFEIINKIDPVVEEALRAINAGIENELAKSLDSKSLNKRK